MTASGVVPPEHGESGSETRTEGSKRHPMTTATPEQTIAEVVNAHTPSGYDGSVNCWCNTEKYPTWQAQSNHVAAEIVKALGLTEQAGCRDPRNANVVHRYVTAWQAT